MLKLPKYPEIAEYVETMFRMGMTIGEIQAIYRISTNQLRKFKNNLEIDPESIKNINSNAMEKLISRGIEEGVIQKTEKVDILIKHLKEREQKQKQGQENEGTQEQPKSIKDRVKVKKPIQRVAVNDSITQKNNQPTSKIENER